MCKGNIPHGQYEHQGDDTDTSNICADPATAFTQANSVLLSWQERRDLVQLLKDADLMWYLRLSRIFTHRLIALTYGEALSADRLREAHSLVDAFAAFGFTEADLLDFFYDEAFNECYSLGAMS